VLTVVCVRTVPHCVLGVRDWFCLAWLHRYNYVLSPRDKGFIHLLRQLGPNTAVYDMTLAFPSLRKGRRPAPIDMVNGNWPETHLHLRRFGPEDYPCTGSDEELATWYVVSCVYVCVFCCWTLFSWLCLGAAQGNRAICRIVSHLIEPLVTLGEQASFTL